MATEVGTLQLKVDTSGVKAGEAAVERLGDAAQKTQAQTTKLATATKRNNAVMGDFGRKAGMAGVQFEQLAGQIAAGQNPMRAIGVQAADLGFVLGAPLLGAVVGIGAAIGSVLIPMLLQGADSAEELSEKFEELGLKFREMTASQQAAFLLTFNENLEELDKNTAQAVARLEELKQARQNLANMPFDEIRRAQAIADITREETLLAAQIDTNIMIRERMIKTLEDQTDAEKEAAREAERAAKEQASRLAMQEKQADSYLKRVLSLNDTEIEAFRRKELEMIEALIRFRDAGVLSKQEYEQAINALEEYGINTRINMQISALEKEMQLAQERTSRITAENNRLMQNLIDADEMRIAHTISATDRLHSENDRLIDGLIAADEKRKESAMETTNALLGFEDVLLKGKSEKSKAAYRLAVNFANAEKRQNAADIISKSYVAAMKAYASLAGIPIIGPALGAAAAATVISAGVSYAAQSLSGRALGGQVRAGESYIVGERGPEVLTMGTGGRITPNEALRDQTNNTSNRTTNVSFNIQAADASGFDRLLNSRRGLIIQMINEAVEDQGREAFV
jgi:hypothetical protein